MMIRYLNKKLKFELVYDDSDRLDDDDLRRWLRRFLGVGDRLELVDSELELGERRRRLRGDRDRLGDGDDEDERSLRLPFLAWPRELSLSSERLILALFLRFLPVK